MKLNVKNLGKMDYMKALFIQERLLKLRQEDKIEDTLLMVEHPPVLTIGRTGSETNIVLKREVLESKGVSVYDVTRGGDVTYHGPGQIVGYPIFDLNNHGRDIKKFVFNIQEVFIRLLKNEYKIDACRADKKYTGVWIGNEKITAIGIAVKKWVTMHGFAFNVSTNLEHFKWIVPCGITDRGVTSLEKLVGYSPDFKELNNKVISYLGEVFNMEPEIKDME